MLRPLTHRSNQFEPLSQYRIAQLQALLFQSARIGIVVRSTPTRPCAAPHGKEKCSADDAPEMGSEISLHQIDSVRPHTANFIILSLYMYCQLKSSNGFKWFEHICTCLCLRSCIQTCSATSLLAPQKLTVQTVRRPQAKSDMLTGYTSITV